MKVIHARNVNDAFAQGIQYLREEGTEADSRAGRVLEAPDPVTTCYARPLERVLWDEQRDANPFFHLYESLWMLDGRNDAASVQKFVKRMGDFSDDGEILWGAYGYRWREWFGKDQLPHVINELRKDPSSRRCILQMWDPEGDLYAKDGHLGVKDRPCNLCIKFEARKGVLDMIVYNRSNDMIMGAYGANVVHMAFLQEYVATMLRIPVGRYWQVSGNFHAYLNTMELVRPSGNVDEDLYTGIGEKVTVCPLVQPMENEDYFLDNLRPFVQSIVNGHNSPMQDTGFYFLDEIARPLFHAYLYQWKYGTTEGRRAAWATVCAIPDMSNDWVLAARMWFKRRMDKL